MKGRMLAVVGLLSLIFLIAILLMFQTKARLIACNVGQGDGLIFIKGGFQMVYDVGPANGKMKECLSRQLPFWDKKIEVMVISHGDADHIGGLEEVLKYYRVVKIFSNHKIKLDNEQNIYSSNLVRGDILRNKSFAFEVVNPGVLAGEEKIEENAESVAGYLSYSDMKILLMGDVEGVREEEILKIGLIKREAAILKAAHHGSDNGSQAELLKAINPKIIIVSSGRGNRYGHPGKRFLKRVESLKIKIARTDVEGDLVFNLE